jgi:transcriptional regulator with XRE-family HTH domain
VSAKDPVSVRVAEFVQGQIDDGELKPGHVAPSGDELHRITGHSPSACREALRLLVEMGVLVPGASPRCRPRVPGDPQAAQLPETDDAARELSAALAGRRHAAGLTQPELATLTKVSVTTIGHAETGRLWQGRRFWKSVDEWLSADGELLALHDAYQYARTVSLSGTGAGRMSLTAGEREVARQAGELYEYIAEHVIGHGPTRDEDLAELRAAVNVIKRMVLAQAAARAFPGEFRLLGEPEASRKSG